MNLRGTCTLNLKLASNAAVSTVRSRCPQMCRRWQNNYTVSSNYDLRFYSRHLMPNTSKGNVLLYETYRGIPTRFQNINKAVNTCTRIMFVVQAHTPCSHLLSYKHLRIFASSHLRIFPPFKHLSPYRHMSPFRRLSSYRYRVRPNLHHTSTRSINVRQRLL